MSYNIKMSLTTQKTTVHNNSHTEQELKNVLMRLLGTDEITPENIKKVEGAYAEAMLESVNVDELDQKAIEASVIIEKKE